MDRREIESRKIDNFSGVFDLLYNGDFVFNKGQSLIKNIDPKRPEAVKNTTIRRLLKYGYGDNIMQVLRDNHEGEMLREFFPDDEQDKTNRSLLIKGEEKDSYEILIIKETQQGDYEIFLNTIEISPETMEECGETIKGIYDNQESQLNSILINVDKNIQI